MAWFDLRRVWEVGRNKEGAEPKHLTGGVVVTNSGQLGEGQGGALCDITQGFQHTRIGLFSLPGGLMARGRLYYESVVIITLIKRFLQNNAYV